jgi:hypothetical protein
LIFSVARGAKLTVLANGASLEPVTTSAVVAEVQIVSRKQLTLALHQGAVRFSYQGQSALLDERRSYQVILDPDDPASTAGTTEKKHAMKDQLRKFLIVAGIGLAVVTTMLIIRNFESPDHP